MLIEVYIQLLPILEFYSYYIHILLMRIIGTLDITKIGKKDQILLIVLIIDFYYNKRFEKILEKNYDNTNASNY
jgi:hypothetical protein